MKAEQCARDDLLHSVPGVGNQLSLSLLAHLTELGTLNRQLTAALVDVASVCRGGATTRRRRAVGASEHAYERPSTWGYGRDQMQSSDPGVLVCDWWPRANQENLPCRVYVEAS